MCFLKMSLEISVIIPTYNCARYLPDAIESVLQQSKQSLVKEIIIVDDGSNDDSTNVLKEYSEKIPRIRTYLTEHAGASQARNIGIQRSKSPLIAFLDADDYWHNNKLEVQAQDFELNSYLQLSTCCGINFYQEVSHIDNSRNTSDRLVRRSNLPGVINIPLPSGWLIKKNVFELIGYFDTSLTIAQDADMFLRIIDFPIVCEWHTEALFHRRLHNNNLSRDLQQNRAEIFKVLQASRNRKSKKAS